MVVDPEVEGRLAVREVGGPEPGPSEAVVAVHSASLNPGELQLAMQADAGSRPGRDLAGTVLRAAADGSGPPEGTRVVGLLARQGSWAERVAVPTDSLAELPDGVDLADASTLPVAGLTALRAVARGGSLLTRRVLITGSTGSVGLFAHQLAALAGATVVGTARTADKRDRVLAAGATEVVVGEDLAPAGAFGPFDLVVDSLGGDALAAALTLLAPGGTCVTIGWSASATATVDVMAFNRVGGATWYGMRLDTELRARPAAPDLAGLARLVAGGRLRTTIGARASWQQVGGLADDVLHGRVTGKAVLRLADEPG